LPWKNNETKVSCIPEGKYFIRKRYSNKFKWHLEVVHVENTSTVNASEDPGDEIIIITPPKKP
tara:strand:+ start:28635 stop:28823 length:189 start_codon:yes stop_codon:yes gene_type:complete